MLWEEYVPRIHLRYDFGECVGIQQTAKIGKERPQSFQDALRCLNCPNAQGGSVLTRGRLL